MATKSASKKWTVKDAKPFIVIPSDLDNKYSRGVLGLITGSAQYPGAAVLTTSAASATGVGMARFHSSSGLAHLVLHTNPEVVVQPGKVDAWVLGSGIDSKKYSDITTWLRHRWFVLVKRQEVPTLLDAGALDLAGKLSQSTLITPHAGELARLLKSRGITVSAEAIEATPARWAVEASEILNVTVLLKGARTVVADGQHVIELPVASPWLATAGTGDVLAGIIGALMATNYIEILNDRHVLAKVAATGALIHSLTADSAVNSGGPINAPSLVAAIPSVVRSILKK